MREIGTVANPAEAARLADYLLTLGIRTKVEPRADGSVASLWVYDEDARDRARAELEAFQSNPNDPRYTQAADAARAIQRQQQAKERQYVKNVVDVRRQWSATSTARRPVTAILAAASLLATVFTGFGNVKDIDSLTLKLFIVPIKLNDHVWDFGTLSDTLRDGQWWRLVTPIFLHLDILHFLFNMSWLLVMGTQIERRRGSWWMLGLVLSTAVTSNVVQYLWKGPSFGGMSGVVYALFGYIWMQSSYDRSSGFVVPQSTVVMMLGWLVLCMTGAIGAVANAAHVAGLAGGMLLGIAPVAWRRLRR